MSEGVRQLRAQQYDQALANFLEAYAKLPAPRILLNIGSTLRDMGRLADAANTYQRYLTDPATGSEHVAEIKDTLLQLDQQLTILTIRVVPSGSDISIDGGPFVAVGSTLLTRVRTGLHLVRIRNGKSTAEQTINGFEGENKEVKAALKMDAPLEDPVKVPPSPPDPTKPPPPPPKAPVKPPENVQAWLDVGTLYTTADPTSRERHVKSSSQGAEITAIVPKYDVGDNGVVEIQHPAEETVLPGALAILRIEPSRGAAAGFGLAYSPSAKFEVEGAVLRSHQWGLYGGARLRILTGQIRPYVGLGVPVFFFDYTDTTTFMTASKVGVGARIAGGIELVINGHFSVQADVGYEHFFNLGNTNFESDIFVPTVGVIGRL